MLTSLLLLSASSSLVVPSISLQAMAPKENEEFSIVASIDIEVANPVYSWSKDGTGLGSSSLTYTIPSFTNKDFGTYIFSLSYLVEEETTTVSKDIVIDHYQMEPPAAPSYMLPLLIGLGALAIVFLVCFFVFLNKKGKKKKK